MEFLKSLLDQNGHNYFIAFMFLILIGIDIFILIIMFKVLSIIEKCKGVN
jgi:hypothetical protein